MNLIPIVLICCMGSTAYAGSNQHIFGSGGLSSQSDNGSHTKTRSPSRQRLWQQEQAFAENLYLRIIGGDYAAAADLKSAADSGNRWAALQYGYLAHTGKLPELNGRPDYHAAIRAYTLSAQRTDGNRLLDLNGNYMAAYNMGLIYYYGSGVAANGAEALRWFRAAESAYRNGKQYRTFWPAAVYIARILENGYGVPKNEKEALAYWERAAKSNEAEGLYGYGMAVLNGRGTVRNPYRAYPLLVQAANRWHIGAMAALARYQNSSDRLRDANPIDAAKWLMIIAVADKRYTHHAERAMAALSAAKQQQVRAQVRSWLSTHGSIPQTFDWKQPINDTVPQR